MIEIRITDPQDHSKEELLTLGAFFIGLAGDGTKPLNIAGDVTVEAERIDSVFNAAELAESGQIAKENDAAHAERNPDPKAVFGAPSTVVANPPSIAPAVPAATLTASTAPVPPVAMPANAAPIAVPPTGAPAGNGETDATGLPWDGRIHSRGKAVNNDGSWKKRRGVDDATVAQVEAELRGVPQFARVVDDGPGTPPAAPIVAPVPPVAPAPVVTPPVAPVPPAAPVTTDAPAIAFPQLLPKVTAAISAGTLTQARVGEVLAAHGLDSLPKLIARPDLVPVVHQQLFGGQ